MNPFRWFGAAALLLAQDPALAECRQALALALDVSGSVDAREYALQRDGVASALATRAVQTALFSDPRNHVDLLIYEWSGPDDLKIIVDWTPLRLPQDIEQVQTQLQTHTRTPASPGTAIGSALLAGQILLDQRKACWQRTLDVSGDGKANIGPPPETARHQLSRSGIVVNALVIGADHAGRDLPVTAEIGELTTYFETRVIAGPDAFVETAVGFDNYAEAMARKLERELRGLSVSALPHALIHQ